MSDKPLCELCGEPMPSGEEMFQYHGYSGPCPKPPLPKIVATVCDGATGGKGSYCIQRPMKDNRTFMEFWNPSGWAGSGHVFTDDKLANSVCDLINMLQKLS